MIISIKDGEFSHTFDDSVNTRIKDGMVEESYTDVHQAIDAFLILLCNFYDKKKIAEDIQEGMYTIR